MILSLSFCSNSRLMLIKDESLGMTKFESFIFSVFISFQLIPDYLIERFYHLQSGKHTDCVSWFCSDTFSVVPLAFSFLAAWKWAW